MAPGLPKDLVPAVVQLVKWYVRVREQVRHGRARRDKPTLLCQILQRQMHEDESPLLRLLVRKLRTKGKRHLRGNVGIGGALWMV